jgi:hypothetical protein
MWPDLAGMTAASGRDRSSIRLMHVLDRARNIAARAITGAECPAGRFTKLYLRDIERKMPILTLAAHRHHA